MPEPKRVHLYRYQMRPNESYFYAVLDSELNAKDAHDTIAHQCVRDYGKYALINFSHVEYLGVAKLYEETDDA